MVIGALAIESGAGAGAENHPATPSDSDIGDGRFCDRAWRAGGKVERKAVGHP